MYVLVGFYVKLSLCDYFEIYVLGLDLLWLIC